MLKKKMICFFFACFGGWMRGRLMLEFEMSWHGSEKTKRFRDATGVAAKRYEEKKKDFASFSLPDERAVRLTHSFSFSDFCCRAFRFRFCRFAVGAHPACCVDVDLRRDRVHQ
jgi:hypothetical protein